MSSHTLTAHLISLPTNPPYSSATRHSFLESAGNGTLPPDRLVLWLHQDWIYAAHAYPKFIGALIANIPFSQTHEVNSYEEARNQRILGILVYSLNNVIREAQFFKNTATELGFDLDNWRERKATRDYTGEMARVVAEGRLEDGLVFLWAMEKVYLDAWSYVHRQLQTTTSHSVEASASIRCVRPFAANWSSEEFSKFVDDLGSLVDDLDMKPGSEEWKRAEELWERVVELESEFWPKEGEEGIYKLE